jgi:uncharacterized membrane protein YeaQ/YmgE (transglycosylase-associated protein family)
VARIYAGILGPLALLTTIVHGMLHARQEDAILLTGWANLLVFAVIGALIGWIAENTVEESVSTAVSRELAATTPDNADNSEPAATRPKRSERPSSATNRGNEVAGPARVGRVK